MLLTVQPDVHHCNATVIHNLGCKFKSPGKAFHYPDPGPTLAHSGGRGPGSRTYLKLSDHPSSSGSKINYLQKPGNEKIKFQAPCLIPGNLAYNWKQHLSVKPLTVSYFKWRASKVIFIILWTVFRQCRSFLSNFENPNNLAQLQFSWLCATIPLTLKSVPLCNFKCQSEERIITGLYTPGSCTKWNLSLAAGNN